MLSDIVHEWNCIFPFSHFVSSETVCVNGPFLPGNAAVNCSICVWWCCAVVQTHITYSSANSSRSKLFTPSHTVKLFAFFIRNFGLQMRIVLRLSPTFFMCVCSEKRKCYFFQRVNCWSARTRVRPSPSRTSWRPRRPQGRAATPASARWVMLFE